MLATPQDSQAPHYLMIGLGKIGLPVANRLAIQHTVTAVSRSFKADLSPVIEQLQADARTLTAELLGDSHHSISHICVIVSPDGSDEQAYQDSYFAVAQAMIALSKDLPNLQRLIYISSTGVYGQHGGEIIDIDTPIQPPISPTSQVLLATEQRLQHHFGEQCTLIRPSGIYGHQRLYLLNLVKQLANDKTNLPNNTWTNRIFDSDLVQVIVNVLTEQTPLPVYLATDFSPVPMFEVLQFLADVQGVSLNLPKQPTTTGKRIISNLPKNWLNYTNYQDGYRAIWQGQSNLVTQPL